MASIGKIVFGLMIAAVATVGFSGEAHAGLLAGGCSTTASLNSVELPQYAEVDEADLGPMYAKVPGLSCQQLQQVEGVADAVRLSLSSIEFAMMVPSVRAALAGEIAAASAAIAASPAVLAVTVVGSVGVFTAYVVVKASIEECKKMEPARLRAELYQDLERVYGLKVRKAVELEVQR